MGWFAVRTVYQFGTKADGTTLYEERIVGFKADTVEDAVRKAELETKQYAERAGVTPHPDQDAYEQDGDPLIDGYELWSILLESRETLERFVEERYRKYDYTPD